MVTVSDSWPTFIGMRMKASTPSMRTATTVVANPDKVAWIW